MSYRVTLYNDSTFESESVKLYMSRSQAIQSMRKTATLTIKTFSKYFRLDTDAAHKTMAAIDKLDDILQPQESRHVAISNTGYSLTIVNTARTPH